MNRLVKLCLFTLAALVCIVYISKSGNRVPSGKDTVAGRFTTSGSKNTEELKLKKIGLQAYLFQYNSKTGVVFDPDTEYERYFMFVDSISLADKYFIYGREKLKSEPVKWHCISELPYDLRDKYSGSYYPGEFRKFRLKEVCFNISKFHKNKATPDEMWKQLDFDSTVIWKFQHD